MPTHIVRNGSTWRREKCNKEPVRGQLCRATRKRRALEDPVLKVKNVRHLPDEEDDGPVAVVDDATSICDSSDTESLCELELDWELSDDDVIWG
jgi:hypothetical protein